MQHHARRAGQTYIAGLWLRALAFVRTGTLGLQLLTARELGSEQSIHARALGGLRIGDAQPLGLVARALSASCIDDRRSLLHTAAFSAKRAAREAARTCGRGAEPPGDSSACKGEAATAARGRGRRRATRTPSAPGALAPQSAAPNLGDCTPRTPRGQHVAPSIHTSRSCTPRRRPPLRAGSSTHAVGPAHRMDRMDAATRSGRNVSPRSPLRLTFAIPIP